LAAGIGATEPPKSPSGQFALDVTVAKGEKPDTYVVTAKVADLQTEKVLNTPRVEARIGEPATLRSGIVVGSESYEILLRVLVKPGHVQYEFKALHNGQVTDQQKVGITL
jgi:hypothetical protein